jgi:hypothetical protein
MILWESVSLLRPAVIIMPSWTAFSEYIFD